MLADQANQSAYEMSPTARPEPQIFYHSFPADPLSVRIALRAALARFLRQISPEEAGTLELVLAEVLNNIVEHGYADSDFGNITLSIVRDRTGLSCSVSDDGVALPDTCLQSASDTDSRPSPDHLPEGGFGWFLIRDLAQDLGYRRDHGRNLLAFRLPLSG